MPKGFPNQQNFSRGLQTKATAGSLPLPDFSTFANARVSEGAATARSGMVRLARASSTVGAITFASASSEYLSAVVDPRPWTLPIEFTFEALLQITDKTATNPLIRVGSSTLAFFVTTASNS